jgi:RHS repeat-associated protein
MSGGTLKSTSSGAQVYAFTSGCTQLQSSSDTMLGRSASYAYDGFNSYTYDAEGNITAVTGNAATYVYNALNQRVRTVVGTATTEYVFNANGQRVSEWNGAHAQLKGKYYWGGTPVAYYTTASSGSVGAHFEHTDWLGTERMRTTYNSAANPTYAVEASYTSLPWGDAQTPAANGSDAAHYAQLDHDAETNTDHADYRQYSNAQGRFMSPDPYDGSYDNSNPQSMNRYVYAANSPLSYIDPSGQDCVYEESGGTFYIKSGDCYSDKDDGTYVNCGSAGDGCMIAGSVSVTGYTGQAGWYDASVNWGASANRYRPSGGGGRGGAGGGRGGGSSGGSSATYVSVLDPNYNQKKCTSGRAEVGLGIVGSLITAGAAVTAVFTGPEEFAGAEGAVTAMHLAPAGVAGPIMVVDGSVSMAQHCR